MTPLLYTAFGVVISMAVVPVMVRLAPRLGMLDLPEPRKVHTHPIPRVGGWGIVLGALVPIAIFMELEPALTWYLFGSLVLLGSGACDDFRDIGHYPKFLGQLLAVVPLVVVAEVQVERLPFMGIDPLPSALMIPFTVFAMIGAINAINHSDGLDGLAGGESLLSLVAIALIGYSVEVPEVSLIALAAIGGVLGFLRFNTHPAQVFMGDAGSQFLGFTLAFLVVLLIQRAESLSAALPALVLGLPLADILAVLAQRIHRGLNWFRATRNHIHHRLLDLGFDHHESVIAIYGMQAFFVVSAVFLRHQSDRLILSLYLGVSLTVFLLLLRAEYSGWRIASGEHPSRTSHLVARVAESRVLSAGPVLFLAVAIPLYLLGSCARIESVPSEYGWYALMLFGLLLFDVVRKNAVAFLGRIAIYAAALFVVFLATGAPDESRVEVGALELVYFGALAAAIALAVRFSQEVRFGTTPLDFLVFFAVILVALFPMNSEQTEMLSILVIEGFIILYGCELLMVRMPQRWAPLIVASLGALALIGIRGLVSI